MMSIFEGEFLLNDVVGVVVFKVVVFVIVIGVFLIEEVGI